MAVMRALGRFLCVVWVVALVPLGGSDAQVIPPSVLPGLGAGATRRAVDVDQPPWRGVVRVQTEVGLHCSGALVGPRVVLTAAHCLFGRRTGQLVRPGSIHVLTAFSRGAYAGHARAVAIETGRGFALGLDGRVPGSSPADADWAVLTIDAALGTPDRVLPLSREVPRGVTAAMLGGYQQDRAQVIVADVDCRIVGAVRVGDALMLRHSCAGTRGVSGAPVLTRGRDGGWLVAGVATVSRVGAAGGEAIPAAMIAARSGVLGSPELRE